MPRSPQGPEKGQKLREWGQDQSVKDVVHINLKEKVTDKVRAEVRKVVEDAALEKVLWGTAEPTRLACLRSFEIVSLAQL